MQINPIIFEKANAHQAQVLCVTKYWSGGETNEILEFVQKDYPDQLYGIGENRVKTLQEKKLPREKTHFIGNIQSRKIPVIFDHVSVIHSLCCPTHLEKIMNLERKTSLEFFLQINISNEPQKSGVLVSDLPQVVENIEILLQKQESPHVFLTGFSAIGMGDFEVKEKIQEFQTLRRLRDRYIPAGIISAGTSRDYEIALGEGIEVVRVGQALVDS